MGELISMPERFRMTPEERDSYERTLRWAEGLGLPEEVKKAILENRIEEMKDWRAVTSKGQLEKKLLQAKIEIALLEYQRVLVKQIPGILKRSNVPERIIGRILLVLAGMSEERIDELEANRTRENLKLVEK